MGSGRPELDERIRLIAERLVRTHLLWKNNHANISLRVPGAEEFVLTGGVMEPFHVESMTRLTLDGTLLEGKLAPQAQEIVDMHGIVYRKRPEIGGIVHTHSPAATAYAVAWTPLPCYTNSLARVDVAGPIPVAPFAPRGSAEAVAGIAQTLDLNPGCRVILLANHGVLAFDTTAEDAAQIAFAVEENAEVALSAVALGGPKPIPADQVHAAAARLAEFARRS